MEGYNSRFVFVLVTIVFCCLSRYVIAQQPALPKVVSPINYCVGSPATALSATGSNLEWVSKSSSYTGEPISTTSAGMHVAADPSNNKYVVFATSVPNVHISSVDYTIPQWQSVNGLRLGIYNSNGSLLSESQTTTSQGGGGSGAIITNVFNFTLSAAGTYSIRVVQGSGQIGFVNYTTVVGAAPVQITGAYGGSRAFTNLRYSYDSYSTTAPVPSTANAGTTSYYVRQTVNGLKSGLSTIVVNVNTIAPPAVNTPINLCQGATAAQLTATGKNLKWSKGILSTVGGTTLLTAATNMGVGGDNDKKTYLNINLPNTTIRSVDFTLPAWQATTDLQLGLYRENTLLATSAPITRSAGGTPIKITVDFNYTIEMPGEYYIGIVAGMGNLGYESSTFPLNEPMGAVSITRVSVPGVRILNNIQFCVPDITSSSLAPSPSTEYVGSTVYYVTQTDGCTSPPAPIIVNVNGIISTNAGMACTNSSVTLKATASPGYTVRWFDSESGGQPITSGVGNNGESLTLPSLTASKTFYAQAINGSCSSRRIAVNAICGGFTRLVWAQTTDWSNGGNWSSCSDGYPNNGADATIPETANRIVLTENITLGNLVIEGNSKIDLNGFTLTVSSISGTGYLSGSKTSRLVLKGTSNMTLRFDQTAAGLTNALGSLTVEGDSRSIILANSLVVSEALEVKGRSAVYSNGNLTLEATKDSNANIGSLINGGSVIGNVKVQSFLTGSNIKNRNFRTLSSPVYNAESPVKGFKVGSYKSYLLVTGPGGEANGFDPSPANGHTIKYYNEPKKAKENQYLYPANAKTEVIDQAKGIYFYFRGNKANPNGSKFSLVNGAYATPEDVVMEYYGEINTGNISPKITFTNNAGEESSNGYNLVGNPYPCVIDWNSTGIIKTNLESTIWVQRANGTFAVYDGKVSSNNGSNYILPGQGFFIKAKANPAITFTENAKVTTAAPSTRLLSAPASASLTLNGIDKQAGLTKIPTLAKLGLVLGMDEYLSDETVVVFDDASETGTDGNDIDYQGEAAISLTSITPEQKYLAINYQPSITQKTELPLYVTAKESGTYSLKLSSKEGMQDLLAFLVDDFTNKTMELHKDSVYNFKIDRGDPLSFGNGRFKIVFQPAYAVPFVLKDFAPDNTGRRVNLNWRTENERYNRLFEVEQSADGKEFYSIGRVSSKEAGKSEASYDFSDAYPLDGINYYRLKVVGENGIYTYSNTVSIDFSSGRSGIVVYPNPATDFVHANVNSASPGDYQVNIYSVNGNGARVLTGKGNSVDVRSLSTGVYVFEIINSRNNTRVGSNKFVKN